MFVYCKIYKKVKWILDMLYNNNSLNIENYNKSLERYNI